MFTTPRCCVSLALNLSVSVFSITQACIKSSKLMFLLPRLSNVRITVSQNCGDLMEEKKNSRRTVNNEVRYMYKIYLPNSLYFLYINIDLQHFETCYRSLKKKSILHKSLVVTVYFLFPFLVLNLSVKCEFLPLDVNYSYWDRNTLLDHFLL